MEEIKQLLTDIIKKLYEVEVEPEVTVAPEGQMVQSRDGANDDSRAAGGVARQAEWATNVAMRLAKEVKKAPREIEGEIEKRVNSTAWVRGDTTDGRKSENKNLKPSFRAEVAGPGFLNFISSDEYFLAKLADFEQNFEKNVSNYSYHDMNVVSEFSDPNPFKVLHVGHLYTSIVGESISRLMEFAGAKVIRANFGGDVGLHVAKTLWALGRSEEVFGILSSTTTQGRLAKVKSSRDSIPNTSSPAQVTEVLATCYVEGTRAYEEDEVAKSEIVELNKKIYEIAEMGEEALDNFAETAKERGGVVSEEDERLARLYWWGKEASYAYFDEFYEKVGVRFDKYYPESTVALRGLEVVREELKNGIYEMSDGAVVFKGEPYGLHTRVFINKEGLPTYEAKDVGLIHQKWDDYHFDKSVVITGNDIIDYMKVVLKSVEQYRPELVERTVHLTHGNVRLPGNEKMSSRKGNFLKAVEVLGMVREAVKECKTPEITEMVALGAVKYAFLKYKVGGNIEFNVEESVETTGNSGPYLQYACVRGRKVLTAISSDESVENDFSDWEMNEWERALAAKVMQYGSVLDEAVAELAPHKICTYLYELAQVFNRFYEHVRVAGSEYEAERAGLVGVYVRVLEHGLGLLGIETPQQM